MVQFVGEMTKEQRRSFIADRNIRNAGGVTT